MSRWSEQFEGHQIHQSLQQLKKWLDTEVEGIDSERETERRRLLKALDAIEVALSAADVELFPEQPLTQLNQQLRQPQIWNNLKNYSSNHGVQQLRDANDHLTGQFPTFSKLLFQTKPTGDSEKLRQVEKAYDRFCKAVEKREKEFSGRLEAVGKKVDELDETSNQLTSDLASMTKEVKQALSEWQGEFTAAQTTRAEEFSSDQIERGEKFDEALRE